jgi:hypothetical protein
LYETIWNSFLSYVSYHNPDSRRLLIQLFQREKNLPFRDLLVWQPSLSKISEDKDLFLVLGELVGFDFFNPFWDWSHVGSVIGLDMALSHGVDLQNVKAPSNNTFANGILQINWNFAIQDFHQYVLAVCSLVDTFLTIASLYSFNVLHDMRDISTLVVEYIFTDQQLTKAVAFRKANEATSSESATSPPSS